MNHMDFNLDSYRSQVREFSNRRDGELFLNRGAGCAKVVLRAIFGKASNKLDLYSGGLSSDVFEESMFEDLFDVSRVDPSNVRIVLVADTTQARNHDLISYLLSKGVDVREFEETGGHIAIADDAMYRFEYDINTKQAICAFGTDQKRPARLNQLIETFGSIWEKASRVELPA